MVVPFRVLLVGPLPGQVDSQGERVVSHGRLVSAWPGVWAQEFLQVTDGWGDKRRLDLATLPAGQDPASPRQQVLISTHELSCLCAIHQILVKHLPEARYVVSWPADTLIWD